METTLKKVEKASYESWHISKRLKIMIENNVNLRLRSKGFKNLAKSRIFVAYQKEQCSLCSLCNFKNIIAYSNLSYFIRVYIFIIT